MSTQLFHIIVLGETPYSRYTGVDANVMGMFMLLAPVVHCLLVFLLSATTVEDFLSLSGYERSEDMEGQKTMTSWRELDWQNRLRLLNLRLIHCLTTALVPWVFRLGTPLNVCLTSHSGTGIVSRKTSHSLRKTSTWSAGNR